MRIGVDVGSVRVGVAISDPEGVLASPVATLRRRWSPLGVGGNRTGDPDARSGAGETGGADDLSEIAELVTEHDAIEVIVGMPLSLSGAEFAAAKAVRTYAAELAMRVSPVSVRLVDERLTSVDAHRALRESGVPGRTQRDVVDQVAATLILQSALDHERHSALAPGEVVRRKRPKRHAKDGER